MISLVVGLKKIIKTIIVNNMEEIVMTIYKNNDIYIEFTQNQDGIGKCCCNLITNDNRLFITPPNY